MKVKGWRIAVTWRGRHVAFISKIYRRFAGGEPVSYEITERPNPRDALVYFNLEQAEETARGVGRLNCNSLMKFHVV